MKTNEAKNIINQLIQGVDPENGEVLPTGTVLDRPIVIRALLLAVSTLSDKSARDSRRAQLPRNIGKEWSAEEHAQLVDEHASKMPMAQIAEKHGRTVRSIEARLEKHGLITKIERTTTDRFSGDAT